LTQEDRKSGCVPQIDRLQEKRKTANLRLMAKIDEIIAKRSLEIDQCERELGITALLQKTTKLQE